MRKDPHTPAERPSSEGADALETNLPAADLPRPAGVYVVAAVVGLEALAMGAIGVWSIFSAFLQPPRSIASAVFLTVLLLALAAGLAAVAVNAFRGFRWTRSAAFVWQLLMVAIAMPALMEGHIAVGLLLLLPPLAAAFFLFTPRVVAFSLRSGGENNVL
ncbi:hypothetical protein ACT3TS_10060 [Specibacter sp. AOP5-B1-6]|uniref:hypothetical protein n=1 Tax=Specibacter sp. AOP5-B1-6 TaxID=3457653 RepID=UPI00402B831F